MKLNIQPMWPIEEYAIILRSWVWIIPNMPPINAFKAVTIISIFLLVVDTRKMIIDRGASFCQVDKIIQLIHDSDIITDGYQKWHGTLPILSKILAKRRLFIKYICDGSHSEILLNNIVAEPIAWARKYLIAASTSWLLLEYRIIGKKLNIFSSIDIHTNNQFVLVRAISVLITNVKEIIKVYGTKKVIKIWRNWTPLLKLEAFTMTTNLMMTSLVSLHFIHEEGQLLKL